MIAFLTSITPGSWPDWIAAIGTSFAFVVAALSYGRSVKVRREAQARLVYAKVTNVEFSDAGSELELLPGGARMGANGGGAYIVMPSSASKARYLATGPVIQLTVTIHNGSKELIGPAKIQVVNTGRKQVYDSVAVRVSTIDPESDYVVSFLLPNADHPGQPSLGATVIFRDASGSWWRRHLSEPIEAVHDDPENAAPTPAERATYAMNARAMGLEPTPEPVVPLQARLHRMSRRLRGKSPTP